MSRHQEFLYVLVKEISGQKNGKHLYDTELRIVYWPKDDESSEQFVVYGSRPDLKSSGKFIPYRLVFKTSYAVCNFVECIVDNVLNMEVELHQFSGITDDSEDEYNIDWFNTNENESTEIVAFDKSGMFNLLLNNMIKILVNAEVV